MPFIQLLSYCYFLFGTSFIDQVAPVGCFFRVFVCVFPPKDLVPFFSIGTIKKTSLVFRMMEFIQKLNFVVVSR